jgi:hypothetical protein
MGSQRPAWFLINSCSQVHLVRKVFLVERWLVQGDVHPNAEIHRARSMGVRGPQKAIDILHVVHPMAQRRPFLILPRLYPRRLNLTRLPTPKPYHKAAILDLVSPARPGNWSNSKVQARVPMNDKYWPALSALTLLPKTETFVIAFFLAAFQYPSGKRDVNNNCDAKNSEYSNATNARGIKKRKYKFSNRHFIALLYKRVTRSFARRGRRFFS